MDYWWNENDYGEPGVRATGERRVSRPLPEIPLLKVKAKNFDVSRSC